MHLSPALLWQVNQKLITLDLFKTGSFAEAHRSSESGVAEWVLGVITVIYSVPMDNIHCVNNYGFNGRTSGADDRGCGRDGPEGGCCGAKAAANGARGLKDGDDGPRLSS
jgi:hypothetical protein